MKQDYVSATHDAGQPGDSGPRNTPVTEVTKQTAETIKQHGSQLGNEAVQQGRNVAGEVRQRLTGEARSQNERLAGGLRQLADDLHRMGQTNQTNQTGTGESIAASVVRQLSDGSRQAADYLEQHGPDGVLREVREFARRKPGTFLLGATVAGFVAGRLGKGLLTGTQGSSDALPYGSASPATVPPVTPSPAGTSTTGTSPVGTSATGGVGPANSRFDDFGANGTVGRGGAPNGVHR